MLSIILFLYADIRPLSSKVEQEFTPVPLNSETSNCQWLSVLQHVLRLAALLRL